MYSTTFQPSALVTPARPYGTLGTTGGTLGAVGSIVPEVSYTTTTAAAPATGIIDCRTDGHQGACCVPHCKAPVDACWKHSCPECGSIKSSRTKTCPNCAPKVGPGSPTRDLPQAVAPQVVAKPTQYDPSTVRWIPESSVVRLQRKFETQHSALYLCLYDGVPAMEKVPLKQENQRNIFKENDMQCIGDRHPNVARTYGLCRRMTGEISMVVEMLEGDLTDRLTASAGEAAETLYPKLALYLVQAARGMQHLHRSGLLHRDLCANNLLVSGQLVKVSDFGLARKQNDHSPSLVPYPLITAPEALRNMEDTSIWTTKCDVWQFGLLMCEVWSCGKNPLAEFNVNVKALLTALDQGWLPKRPANCNDDLWRLTVECLQQEPKKRPTFEDIVVRLETIWGDIHS